MSLPNLPKENSNFAVSHFYPEEDKILKQIEDIQFWQDNALNTFLEENFKQSEKPNQLELLEEENNKLENDILEMMRNVDILNNKFNQAKNDRENCNNLEEEMKIEYERLYNEVKSAEEESDKKLYRLNELENPEIFAEHIYSSFDSDTGLCLTREIQTNYTAQTLNIHKMQEMMWNQMYVLQMQALQNQMNMNMNINTNSKENDGQNMNIYNDYMKVMYENMMGMNQFNNMNINNNNSTQYNPQEKENNDENNIKKSEISNTEEHPHKT